MCDDLKQIPGNFLKKESERGESVCEWDLGMGWDNDDASSEQNARDARRKGFLIQQEI